MEDIGSNPIRPHRTTLARLHADVRRDDETARARIRAHVLEHWRAVEAIDEPARLRYLLRVILDARLIDESEFGPIIAEVLRLLEPADAALPALCTWFDSEMSGHARLQLPTQPGNVAALVRRIAHAVKRGTELGMILRLTTHGVAAVLGQSAETPSVARATVYRIVLARMIEALERPEICSEPEHAASFLAWLVEIALVRVDPNVHCEPLVEAIAAVFRQPVEQQAKLLELTLLDTPAVEELYADAEALELALSDWG